MHHFFFITQFLWIFEDIDVNGFETVLHLNKLALDFVPCPPPWSPDAELVCFTTELAHFAMKVGCFGLVSKSPACCKAGRTVHGQCVTCTMYGSSRAVGQLQSHRHPAQGRAVVMIWPDGCESLQMRALRSCNWLAVIKSQSVCGVGVLLGREEEGTFLREKSDCFT